MALKKRFDPLATRLDVLAMACAGLWMCVTIIDVIGFEVLRNGNINYPAEIAFLGGGYCLAITSIIAVWKLPPRIRINPRNADSGAILVLAMSINLACQAVEMKAVTTQAGDILRYILIGGSIAGVTTVLAYGTSRFLSRNR